MVATPLNGVKPTVVLVHGAWADTSSWDGEVSALTKQGYDARAIANPLENLTTDSECVANFLKSMSGAIVLVGHSYGGSVITNAAEGNPNVKALVYVDAAAPDVGETNGSLSGSDSILKQKPESELFDKVPYPGAPPGTIDLYLKKDVFLHNFGNDLPADEATRSGRHNASRRAMHSKRPPKPRRGRRFRRGTSSTAATRSSRPPPRSGWPSGHTPA